MNYDEVLGQIHQLVEAGEAVNWSRAELVTAALGLEGVTARKLASDMGCSASHVRRLAKTYAEFPSAESRWHGPGSSFTHHRLAAETKEPAEWLQKAMDHEWSVRDMADAIKLSKAADPVEQAYAQAERVIQRLRRTWHGADDALKEHMRGPLRAFWEAELQ